MRQTFAIATVVLAALWCAGCEDRGRAEEAHAPPAAIDQPLPKLEITLPRPMSCG